MPSGETLMTGRDGSLEALARALGPGVERDHPLGPLTTYRVGGTAALFEEVADEARLEEVARCTAGTTCRYWSSGEDRTCSWPTLGSTDWWCPWVRGSTPWTVEGDRVRAGAALSLPVLARRTAAAGLQGLEWAVGVPGSVGGAVRMNAGGHGSDTAATLVEYAWVDLATGSVGRSPADRLESAYRTTALAPSEVVVSGTFLLEPGDPAEGAAAIAEIVRWRRAHQPGGSNAGSVFTNPPGDSAGRLIDHCALKGFRIGSAEVSTKHANFIQADPGGSADDVLSVIEHVRTVVAEATGHGPACRGPADRLPGAGEGDPVSPTDPPDERRPVRSAGGGEHPTVHRPDVAA